jgi:hypothetical protein
MTPQFLRNERIAQLLVDRAIDGLDTESERELKRLSTQYSDYEDDAIDRVAAAVSISNLTTEEVPEGLRERLEFDAQRWVKDHAAEGAEVVDLASRRDRPAPRPWMQWLAAASVLVAAVGWYQASMVAMERDSLQAQLATLEADLESQRQLVAQLRNPPPADLGAMRARLAGGGASVISWSSTEDPAASQASGDLVWDDRQQEGYMRFKGLAPNDPDVYQYQLWIFDATRDERHPVDGGVFDVPSGSDEVIVPIRAKLPVGEPVLFAITVEKPGGVVVSDRERIALVAKPNQEI